LQREAFFCRGGGGKGFLLGGERGKGIGGLLGLVVAEVKEAASFSALEGQILSEGAPLDGKWEGSIVWGAWGVRSGF